MTRKAGILSLVLSVLALVLACAALISASGVKKTETAEPERAAVRYNSGHSFGTKTGILTGPFVKYWTPLVSSEA